MNRKSQFLLLSLVLISLFIPTDPAQALIGTGIFDYFETALGGTEEFASFTTQLYQGIGLLLALSYGLLITSAFLLQEVISIPIGLKTSEIVLRGWNFTLGFTNLFFILIFIIIAISFILKIESLAKKEVLTNLIIVALLINFSLVFVGVFTDIATFFQNTILNDNFDLVTSSIDSLAGGIEGIVKTLFTFLIGLLALYAVPFTGPFAQVAIVTRSLTLVLFLPTFLGWLSTIFISLSLATLFFTYFFLFVCRIFVIWALAILAPLAFACRILPSTKKWWDEWFKHLSDWTALGIVLLFWITLGLRLTAYLVPNLGPTIMPIKGWYSMDPSLKYYLFLFVYLCIGLFIQQKFTPALTSTLMSQGKALGGMLLNRGLKPIGKALSMGAREAEDLQGEEEEKARRRMDLGETLTRRQRLGLGFGRVMATPARWAYRVSGTTPQLEREKLLKSAQERTEKLTDEQLFRLLGGKGLLDLIGSYNVPDRTRNEAILQIAQRGKLKDAITQKLTTDDEIINIEKRLRQKGRGGDATILASSSKELFEKIMEANFDKEMLEVKRLKMQAQKIKSSYPDLSQENINTINEAQGLVDVGEKNIEYAKKIDKDGKLQISEGYELLKEEGLPLEERKKINEMIAEGQEMIKAAKEYRKDGEKMKSDGGLMMGGIGVRVNKKTLDLVKQAEEVEKKANTIYQESFNKLLVKVPTDQIKNIDRNILKTKEAKEWIIESFDGEKMAEIAKHFGSNVVTSIQDEIDKKPMLGLAQKNPKLAFYLTGNPAQMLGYGLPEKAAGISKKQLREIVKQGRMLTEKNLTKKMKSIMEEYSGKEQMIFRDYYRKGVSNQMKTALKQVISKENQTIPSKQEMHKRIGKYEEKISEIDERTISLLNRYKRLEKEYHKAKKPLSGTVYSAWKIGQKEFDKSMKSLEKAREKLVKIEEKSLAGLWKK